MSKANSNSRLGWYKSNSINSQSSRTRRHEVAIELRKSKREELKLKRRNIDVETLSWPVKQQLSGQSAGQLSVTEIVAAMNGGDEARQFQAMQSARKMLSRKRDPPIDLLIAHGIVPICIRFLQTTPNTLLQFEAARALTNIASGSSDQTRCVIEHNAVPHFVALLQSQSFLLAYQAVWALANIAGDGAAAREIVIQHNVIDGILPLINGETPPTLLRNIVWLMANLCRSKKPSPFEQVKRLLPVLSQLLQSQDIEVLSDACWALAYVTDDNSKIQAVVNSDAVPRLVELLQKNEPSIIEPALHSVGNIVTGTDQQTDVVIASGGLPRLGWLLQHSKSHIVKEAAWTVSNITSGNQEQIQAVMQAGTFGQLRRVLENGDFDSQREAAWAVTNTLTLGTTEQIVQLLEEYKILKPFIGLLGAQDPRTVKVVLAGLFKLFARADKLGSTEHLCSMVEEMGGLDKLELLLQHSNKLVAKKACAIIDTYFNNSEDGEAEQELAPQKDNGSRNAIQLKSPEDGYKY